MPRHTTKKQLTHNTHTSTLSSISMPTLTEVPKAKQWGKYDRHRLHSLIIEGKVNIEDVTYDNIDSVHAKYFPERQQRNFRRNFKDFAAAFDLETALAGARREEAEQGEMRVCLRFVC